MVKRQMVLPRAPRHPVKCRRVDPVCCQWVRDALNRRFRKANRRYARYAGQTAGEWD